MTGSVRLHPNDFIGRYGRRAALQRLQRPGWRAPIARLVPAPLEVTFRLRVLAWPRSSGSFGSPLPPRALARRRVSRLAVFLRRPSLDGRGVCRAILSRGSAFYRVSRTTLPPSFRGSASPGLSVPFSAVGLAGYVPRSSTLGYRPRPRFLTVLAGILPANPFRACFIPEALLGFSLQGVPLGRSALGSSPKAPLVSFPRWPPYPLSECLGLPATKAGSTSGVSTSSESVRGSGTV